MGPFLLLLLLACWTFSVSAGNFVFVAVSGGLQDGFPDRRFLNYHHGEPDEITAVYWGTALVRGYKAFLDIKQPTWREYKPAPQTPHVNPAVVPTGCWEHANVYAVYAVDERQALAALNAEPRFLSMSPDTGIADLATEETSDSVRRTARRQAAADGSANADSAAFLTVTSVWFQDTFVESPVLYTKADGTEVTDFPNSIAAWAGTTVAARENPETAGDYWEAVTLAVRRAETGPAPAVRPPFQCKSPARFGVDPGTTRMNKVYTACQLVELAQHAGVRWSTTECTTPTCSKA